MFCGANRAGYVIYDHNGMYTLVAPDSHTTMIFLGRVVASSAIWRHVIAELRDWLKHTAES